MRRVALVSILLLTATRILPACPTCYGSPGSPMTDGMNMAILSLLGITGFVLFGFVSFFVYLRRRAAAIDKLFSQRLN